MIVLNSYPEEARRQLAAIQAMMDAIGQAQGNHLGSVQRSFSRAESRALSLVQRGDGFILGVDLGVAQAGRSPHRVSWVFRRLHEMASSQAAVRVATQRQVTSFLRADGGTRPRFEDYILPGRGSFRLPGPVRTVDVSVATVHPLTGVDRTLLDMGRTLVHELVVHAWRDISFYQRALGTDQPRADPATTSEHRDYPHFPGSMGPHNLADAEADLIDYYYDLARGHTLRFGEAHHPGFSRIIRVLGGVMGSRIPTLGARHRATSEYTAEQARFLEQVRLFRQQMDRMRQLESRISR
jgi:hypothetical protein